MDNKQHHKIPTCYLSNFSDQDNKIWLLSQNNILLHQKPEKSLRENNYYTIKFESGGGTLIVEHELAYFESIYTIIFDTKIKKHLKLTFEEKANLAIFIAAMDIRTDKFRKVWLKAMEDIENMANQMRAVPHEKRIYCEPINSNNTMSVDDLLKTKDDMSSFHSKAINNTVPDLSRIIFKMNWGFIYTNKNSFITSDNPVSIINPFIINSKKYILGGHSILGEDTELTFPLSDDIALIAGWKIKEDLCYLKADNKQIKDINIRTRLTAISHLVANNKNILNQQQQNSCKMLNNEN